MVSLASALPPHVSLVGYGAPGTTYNSHWAYPSHMPTINGHVTPGEYTNATVRNFTLNMRTSTGISVKNVQARLLVKNDHSNIYVAIQIFNVPFNNRNSTYPDEIAIYFDNNHTGVIAQGDQGEAVETNPAETIYSHNDLYYSSSYASWTPVYSAGKTEDGELAWNHTGWGTLDKIGNYTVEMEIPLVDASPGYGFSITSLPWTVGYKIFFFEGWYNTTTHYVAGVYPDSGADPTSQTLNAATFGALILNPLYTLTVTATAGGTTSPAPGAYQFDFGEVATVTANPNSGYVFDYWVLNGTSVGSANPYSVTMNTYMNQTLQAVFIKSVPTAVGGMAAPIVVSTNEPGSMTPLVWLASAIMVSIALATVFVRLRKKKF
jgi:hypothetical protein